MVDFPPGWKRTPPEDRDHGSRFHVSKGQNAYGHVQRGPPTYYQASERVLAEAQRIDGATDILIECDLKFRQDGALYSKQRVPSDPGVVLRFKRHGVAFAIPCDRFDTIEANLTAIALMVESQRLLDRYGFDVFRQDFKGYAALPEGSGESYGVIIAEPAPHEVLGIPENADVDVITAVYRRKAGKAHPDRPDGDEELFKRLTAARDAMLKRLEVA